MANPFTKAWKYLMALFSSKVDEYADPKVQIQQAIEDAQRQHQALSQQAAAVIGNQRQLEMKLNRQLGEIEKLQASARQALVLADRQRAAGDEAGAQRYEETAQVYASQLVTAEQSVEDLKTLHDQSIQAAGQAKKAVERNSMMLQQKIAERTKLLSQLEQAKMQEQAADVAAADDRARPRRGTPLAGGGPRQDRAALRERDRAGGARAELGAGPDARGAAVDDRHGRPEPAGADPRLAARRPGRGRGHGGPARRRAALVGPGPGGPAGRPARCSSPAPTESRTPSRGGRRPRPARPSAALAG